MSTPWSRIQDKLANGKVVLLDGGTGTLVSEQGVHPTDFLFPWAVEGLIVHPTVLMNAHADYIAVGCDIITANAFRTSRFAIRQTLRQKLHLCLGIKDEECKLISMVAQLSDGWQRLSEPVTQLALILANVARTRTPNGQAVAIAGNITTLEDCYRPDLVPDANTLRQEHTDNVRQLTARPELLDFLLMETINTSREACAAVAAAFDVAPQLPVWVAYVLDRSPKEDDRERPARLYPSRCPTTGDELPGELLSDAVEQLLRMKTERGQAINAMLFNCTTPQAITHALTEMNERGMMKRLEQAGIYVGAYANAETENTDGMWRRDGDFSYEAYGNHALKWKDQGAKIIGGCCGTRPRDMAYIRKFLNGM